MISQAELSKGCLFPCPIYAQLRLSALLIKTASFFPHWSLISPSLKGKCSRIQAAGPQPQLGLLRQVSGVSGASLILLLLSFGS